MNYLNNPKWIVILLLLIRFNSFSQMDWNSELKINWSNFKGNAPKTSEFKANTATYFVCEYGSNDTCFFYNVKNLFDKFKSWHKDSTNDLLEHERGHFDISEIYARKIRKFLKTNLLLATPDNSIRQGIEALEKQKNIYQKLYDKETNFSLNYEKQLEWQNKIKRQLKELDNYNESEYNHCPES